MPTEKGLPAANVTVGLSNSFYLLRQGVSQRGVKFVEVPASCLLVHEGSGQICSVEWRRVGDCFPELSYERVTSFSRCESGVLMIVFCESSACLR